jgi:hypothetical protein
MATYDASHPQLALRCPVAQIFAIQARPQRRHCLVDVVGLELRNVVAKYPFERSHEFLGIQPNSGHRDYSRLSCAVWERSSGLGIMARRPP